MAKSPPPEPPREHTLLLSLFALFLFASPFTLWMASDASPWFLPYLSWSLLILLGAWIRIMAKRNDV